LRPLLLGCERNAPRVKSAADLSSWSGTPLVNVRGTPGSLGFFAVARHDQSPVIVSAHHVLFGGGAKAGSAVWAADRTRGSRWRCVGRTLYGRSGTVRHNGVNAYVDCAVALIECPELAESVLSAQPAYATGRSLAPGDRVAKFGAATGNTDGVVVDNSHRVATLGHRAFDAPGQLLIRSTVRGRPFAAEGDSGSVLCNRDGDVVGMLWAATAAGEGIASPIETVLYVLNVMPAPFGPYEDR
jgi:S1-C subfamily serine protease